MKKEYQDRWNTPLVNKPVYYKQPKYAVIIENQVNESQLTYGQYNTFHEASQALIYVKSVNFIDNCYIDELWFKSGCMFQNTASDLDDCYNCIDGDLSPEESRARNRLIKLCQLLVEATEIEENDEA